MYSLNESMLVDRFRDAYVQLVGDSETSTDRVWRDLVSNDVPLFCQPLDIGGYDLPVSVITPLFRHAGYMRLDHEFINSFSALESLSLAAFAPEHAERIRRPVQAGRSVGFKRVQTRADGSADARALVPEHAVLYSRRDYREIVLILDAGRSYAAAAVRVEREAASRHRLGNGEYYAYRLRPDGLPGAPALSWCHDGDARLRALLLRRDLYIASYLGGFCWAVVEATRARTRQRRQFSRPIIDNQSVAHAIARLIAELESLDALIRHATHHLGQMQEHRLDAHLKSSAVRALRRTADTCQHFYGAYGLTTTSEASAFYQQALRFDFEMAD